MKQRINPKIILMVLSMFFLMACASTRPVVVASYEALGSTIVSVGKAAKILCNEGKIEASKCENIKNIYNDVRKYYKDSGDLYIKVIQTGSDEDIKNYKAHIQVVFEGLKKIEKYLTKK